MRVVIQRKPFSGSPIEMAASIWSCEDARLWLVLNLVDLAESIVTHELGCGELNPFIPLDSLVGALCYKVLLTIGALLFLKRIKRLHLVRWLNIAMLVVIAWNAAVILMSRTL